MAFFPYKVTDKKLAHVYLKNSSFNVRFIQSTRYNIHLHFISSLQSSFTNLEDGQKVVGTYISYTLFYYNPPSPHSTEYISPFNV